MPFCNLFMERPSYMIQETAYGQTIKSLTSTIMIDVSNSLNIYTVYIFKVYWR